MGAHGKETEKPENEGRARSARGKAAGMFAQKSAIEHDIENAVDVAAAKAKAMAANAKVEVAEKKRDVQKRIDDARIAAHKNK